MSEQWIHKTAIVCEQAKIADGVKIGPYAYISSPDVILEEGVEIGPYVSIEGKVRIGKGSRVHSHAAIGGLAQGRNLQGERSEVSIGQNCVIREYVTVHASIGKAGSVDIGNDCYIMAYSHIGHSCKIGKGVTITNSVNLGGGVVVDDFATIGGQCSIHQGVRIGSYAMVGGGSLVTHDLPPFTTGQGYTMLVRGINRIGLLRKGYSFEDRKWITRLYRITFQLGYSLEEAIEIIRSEMGSVEVAKVWIDFCENSKRGIARYKREKMGKTSEPLVNV
jgi:UDP-N-acetylglucosamine acyltransferase